MEELRKYLENVPDSYTDFVDGMLNHARYSKKKERRLLQYLTEHPGATSSDVLRYMMSFPDFFDNMETEFAEELQGQIA